MASTYRDWVEAVRQAADIAEIVGETVALRRAGRSLVGLCPFHQEKTPSFHVDPGKQLFYCHGCHTGGDVFRYVQLLHQVDFNEAVGLLADRYGIPRPARAAGRNEAREAGRRRRALAALAEAREFFRARLEGAGGEAARRYLASRGYGPEERERFDLGFAPDSWDALLRHLSGKGFGLDDIVFAGLAVPRASGEGAYDRFRGRVTFPIRDPAGRVVSFGGRALGDATPKYLNGPETRVYDKGRVLYRVHEEGKALRESRRAVLVEGYFDALGLARAGVGGAVAVCGTAFGEGHGRLLARFCETVVLVFDGDSAGRRAVHRALPALLARGLGVRIVLLPEGKDPDDLARERGAAGVAEALDGAMDLVDFLVLEARRAFDLSSLEGRTRAVEMVLRHLAALASPIARDDAALRVAAGLGIDDRLVVDELRRAARARARTARAEIPGRNIAPARAFSPAEGVLLRWLAGAGRSRPALALELLAGLPREALGEASRRLVSAWEEAARRGDAWDAARFADAAEGPLREPFLALLFGPAPEPGEAEARGAVLALRERALRARMRELQEEIERAGDGAERTRLLAEKVALARELHGLGTARGEGPGPREPVPGFREGAP